VLDRQTRAAVGCHAGAELTKTGLEADLSGKQGHSPCASAALEATVSVRCKARQ
jgi:hypothetical protein